MVNLVNAAPKVIFGGLNDQSRGTLVREAETFPQHLPLLRLFCETGPTETTLVGPGASFADIYGSQTLNRRGKYFNMQSLLAETLLAEGQSIFVKRLQPSDAKPPARIILALDLLEDEIPRWSQVLDGFNYPGIDPDQIDFDETVPGFRGKIVLIEDNTGAVGSKTTMPGSMTSADTLEQSIIYPLMELPVSFFGEAGNNVGFRMWAPTLNDNLPFDEQTAEEFSVRMYRMQFMRRQHPTASPTTIRTVLGEDYVDVVFDKDIYSRSTDKEYYVGDTLIQSYEDDGFTSGEGPIYSPFSEIYVYHDNLDTVRNILYDNELVVNPAAETHLKGPGQFDVFSGIDINGFRYQGFMLEGPLEGGIRLGQANTVFAVGGDDGTTDLEEYEELVTLENVNFGELGDEYENLAVYPFSVIYDTGLKMENKFEMMRVLGKRSDIQVRFTTFVESDGRMPTRSEELSRSQAIMAQLRAYPESVLHGTPVCRAEIIMQTGRLADGSYTKPVPQLLDYAQRWARFAGAGTGVLREGADIDVSPNNRVELIKGLNVDFLNSRLASNMWEAGATYTQSYDRRSQYYPAIHSVYNDDTSVLISPITVSICCDVIRLIHRVHAEFSGNAQLTKEQLVERSDELITELVDGRYGDRVQVVPETRITAADEARGFSWHCRVTVYANNPRNVMIFDLETRRMDELTQ